MVADKLSQPTSRDEFEIAIVCTRALEYDAVCFLLDGFWDMDGDPFGRARGDLNTYTTGYMGKYNIVVVLLCNSGKANAASTSASLRSSYPCIELLLLTGICEGVPDANEEELLLGDVIISETVIQYDLSSPFHHALKRRSTLEDRQGRANNNIRKFIANFKTEMGLQRLEEKATLHLEQIQSLVSEAKYRQRHKGATYMYPGFETDILFESTHCHRHYNSSQLCDEARNLDCEQTGCGLRTLKHRDRLHQKSLLELKAAQIPSIFFGRFGSGDTAFNSGVHRDSLAKTHGIIAFEMEGAGIWDELPCIIVKGVSDYGDGHKTRKWAEWQNFAAATSASVARALIERYPQTDKSPVTELKADQVHSQLQENRTCLDALFITNPEDDKQRIEDTKGGLLLDAYIWIIRNEEFVQWLDDPETRLLWIKGDPGKGKTMLLCGIINELKTTSSRGNIYYFLCQATDNRLNNASAILRGLLHMMVVQYPALISYIRHEYDKSGKSAFEGVNSWIILSRIFEQMLKDDLLKSREPIFIIDALDECVVDSTQFLEIIVRLSTSSSQAKWLVSSRNEADIQESLATAENKSTVSLELNAESVSNAISTYIRHKVQLLANRKGYKQPTREKIERYLSNNANGTFLWVALISLQGLINSMKG
ncbi:NACHT domain-containing protein [Trichoderma breve]|uniref:NACHT domain-containing protein n=1 Tax=Trichoderma breve TaxID=2034170 RepID=A0A9W9B699_9HYPO|nr:NACHT domain-containing protein [Trichoderma breve]KAJ4855399.1 NACHT domain-containing protein [Trichoderma breve]